MPADRSKVLEALFRGGAAPGAKDVVVEHHPIGDVTLTSGRVVSCDPFDLPSALPFARRLGADDYEVVVCVADMPGEEEGARDRQVAGAFLRAAKGTPATWEAARVVGQDERDRDVSFDVVAGAACFVDADALRAFGGEADDDDDDERGDDRWGSGWDDDDEDEEDEEGETTEAWDEFTDRLEAVLRRAKTKVRTANLPWGDDGDGNLLAFACRDGAIVPYVGLDAKGQVVCFLIDVGVLPTPEGKPKKK